jgi:uncharacterized protein (TIGR00106 family)
MAIVEINIVPLGTSTPSVGRYIADAVEILKESGLKYELTSMGTIIEGDLDEILSLAKKMHETPFFKGVKRVVTTIKIDDRRDMEATSSDKIRSVTDKLRREVTDDFKRKGYQSSGA